MRAYKGRTNGYSLEDVIRRGQTFAIQSALGILGAEHRGPRGQAAYRLVEKTATCAICGQSYVLQWSGSEATTCSVHCAHILLERRKQAADAKPLTAAQVRTIRRRAQGGESIRAIAKESGVSQATVWNILSHRRYTWVTDEDESAANAPA